MRWILFILAAIVGSMLAVGAALWLASPTFRGEATELANRLTPPEPSREPASATAPGAAPADDTREEPSDDDLIGLKVVPIRVVKPIRSSTTTTTDDLEAWVEAQLKEINQAYEKEMKAKLAELRKQLEKEDTTQRKRILDMVAQEFVRRRQQWENRIKELRAALGVPPEPPSPAAGRGGVR